MPVYAEAGSVTLPRPVFHLLRDSQGDSFTLADLGVLTAMLLQLASETPIMRGAHLEHDAEGEPVLVASGELQDLSFTDSVNPASQVMLPVCLPQLARFGWLDIKYEAGCVRIKRGPVARKARDGSQTLARA